MAHTTLARGFARLFRGVDSIRRGMSTVAGEATDPLSGNLKQMGVPEKYMAKAGTRPTMRHDTYRCGTIGTKMGSTTLWDAWGEMHHVVLIKLRNNYVLSSQPSKVGGELNVQIGADDGRSHEAEDFEREEELKDSEKLLLTRHEWRNRMTDALGLPVLRHHAAFFVSRNALPPVGHEITSAHYSAGAYIDVAAKTIARGFQGVMKRWGFKGQPASHGVSIKHRSPGSIGCSRNPGKVHKGTRMAGHMGNKWRIVNGLRILRIDHDESMLYVAGAVPGSVGSPVRITDCDAKLVAAGPVPTALVPKTGFETVASKDTSQGMFAQLAVAKLKDDASAEAVAAKGKSGGAGRRK